MGETDLASVIPIAEDYGDRSIDLLPGDLELAVPQLFRLPEPWSFTRGYRTSLMVFLADPADESQRIVMTGTAAVTYQFFDDGERRVQIETADTSDPAVRLWADSITHGAPTSTMPHGIGRVSGPTAVLDAGDELVRATYSDGEPFDNPPTEEHIPQRISEIEAGALRAIEALVT